MVQKSLLIIVILIIVAVGIISQWPYILEHESLGNWASVVTILSVITIPIGYLLNQRNIEQQRKEEENEERKLASRNLYGELQDSLISLDEQKFPEDLFDVKFGGKTMTFMNRFLNHDIYDALVFSGKIGFLKFESQQKIQDVFKKIKRHNYYLRYITEFEDKNNNENMKRYYELLDKDERSLLDEIPNIMKKLKKEFGFDPST